MIIKDNTVWAHRLTATLILLLVISLFLVLVVMPVLMQWSNDQKTIDELHNRINHYGKLVSEKKLLESSIENVRASSNKRHGFLSAKVPSLAAADLQRQIISMVEAVDGQILSTQTMNENVDDIYERISVNLRVKMVTDDLRELLYRIESSTPYLFIDEIRINKGRRTTFDQTSKNDLDVSMKISGYMQRQT